MTQDHVASFIHEMNEVSSGVRADMDQFNVTKYFMAHVDDQGEFVQTVKYDIPQVPAQERTMKMGKMDYISHVLKELGSPGDHRSQVDIQNIDIAADGREATVVVINHENGEIPVQDMSGSSSMVPVNGTSYCEQTLVMKDKDIVMQKANCTTSLDYAQSE
jgi:hypothetical protein